MPDPERRTYEVPAGAIEKAKAEQQAELEASRREITNRQILVMEADGETICRSCGEPLIWALREGAQAVPINRAPDPEGTVGVNAHDEWVFGLDRRTPGQLELGGTGEPPPRYRLHFETCPDRDRWHRWGLLRRQQAAKGER